uniref:Pre-mRNA-splicing regulator WTAP n=2 Tax=Clastoptera arizonana TaxID=38151 RepID=A0A1B6CWB8_9HEMI
MNIKEEKMTEESSSVVSTPSPQQATTATVASSPVRNRVKLTEQQLDNVTRDELITFWKDQDLYIDLIEVKATSIEVELTNHKETEEKLKQQYSDLLLREKVLVRRLAAKEQEMQEYAAQLSELKAGQAPGVAALRSALLDPAVNLLLQRLRQELASVRTRLEETQNELSAWKFTPDSNTGKRLMAKCRLLYQENEELGRVISSGRVAKLEGELALQKSFSEEVKKSQSELDEFLQELDEDVEGMQSTIYYLQQELRKSKEALSLLEQENNNLKNGITNAEEVSSGGGRPRTPQSTKGESVCNGDVKQDWDRTSQPNREEESSCDSNDLIIKIAPEDEMSDIENKVQQPCSESVNNNVMESPRKRTSSEDSDDVPLIKKVRRDSELSIHYSDDEVALTNGESNVGNVS